MILIDMPMPDNCVECRFNVSEFGYCNAMPVNFCGQVSDCEEDGKPDWCPLKAQEPKLVYVTADINHRKIGECPNCGKMINSGDYPNYCGRCGQAVKWDG